MISRAVFVLPSLVENQPLVVPEAMVFERPVVASRLPGTEIEILDGWSGLLFEAGNASHLAAKIKSVIVNQALASELGRNARKYVECQLNLEHLAEQVTRAYLEVASTSYSAD